MVAIAMDKSIATVVSILAVLKAGAIYMPLPQAYPGNGYASCSKMPSPFVS